MMHLFSILFNSQLFVNTFTLTFIAEWGDRSQLATIVLAGINNVYGVIVGEWPHVLGCNMLHVTLYMPVFVRIIRTIRIVRTE